jgi:hypothetical protein
MHLSRTQIGPVLAALLAAGCQATMEDGIELLDQNNVRDTAATKQCDGRSFTGIVRAEAAEGWVGVPGVAVYLWSVTEEAASHSEMAITGGDGTFTVACASGATAILQVYWGYPSQPQLAVTGQEPVKDLVYQQLVERSSPGLHDIWVGGAERAPLAYLSLNVTGLTMFNNDQLALRSVETGERVWRLASSSTLFLDPLLKPGQYVLEYLRAPEDLAPPEPVPSDPQASTQRFCKVGDSWEVTLGDGPTVLNIQRPTTAAGCPE